MKESTENSLYHFKREKEYFLEIINEFKFTPRYNREYILLNPKDERQAIEMIIPMVCWCDIPLQRIENHTSRYGEFGIGITKQWAISNLINPVFYVIEDTVLALSINQINTSLIELEELFESDRELTLKMFNITSKLYPAFDYLNQHIKPYNYQKKETRQENRKFYDEKEWRYIPDSMYSENLIIYPYQYENGEELLNKIDTSNEKIKIRNLSFKPDDVTIIIIEKESDRNEIEKVIFKVFTQNKFPNYEQFLSKIRTIAQIKEGDFKDE